MRFKVSFKTKELMGRLLGWPLGGALLAWLEFELVDIADIRLAWERAGVAAKPVLMRRRLILNATCTLGCC